MADFVDYYEILQVSPSAEPEVIEGAYKKLAKKYHPDVNKSPSATERMKKINVAHDILSNLDKRREYDKEWQRHKVGDARPGGAPHNKTSQNNTQTGRRKDDRSKPQGRSHERRIVLVVLLIADIVLLIIFLLVPWIRQTIAHYPWLKVTLLLLILAFAGVAVGFQRFRRVLTNAIKSFTYVTRRWVTGGDSDKAPHDRIAIIILSIILIALLVIFLLIPWIRIIIARYPWMKIIFWVLVAICIFGMLKSQSFRRSLYNSIKAIFAAIKSIVIWITSEGKKTDKEQEIKREEACFPEWTWKPQGILGQLESDVWNYMLCFRSEGHPQTEDDFHKQLYAHLKKRFPQAQWKPKPKRGASQPDIAIDNIGIEVKGPTKNAHLKDILQKAPRYLLYWNPTFAILFAPQFGQGLTEKYFREFKVGIQRHFRDVGVITKINY